MNDKIDKCETASSVIPSGLTSKLQPSNISINNVFKESLRNKYVDYWIGKKIIASINAIVECMMSYDILILL